MKFDLRRALVRRLGLPPRRVVLWSAASAAPMAAVIIFGAFMSYHGHVLLVQSRERVDHTQQVLSVLNKLFISLEDAETGQRGFVITGDQSYLSPYTSAAEAAPRTYALLRQLVADAPDQENRVSRLERLIGMKLGELGRVISLRESQGFEAAAAAIARGEGKRVMDDVRLAVDEIASAESSVLADRQRDAQRREKEVIRVGFVVAVLSVLTRILIAVALKRLRRRPVATRDRHGSDR